MDSCLLEGLLTRTEFNNTDFNLIRQFHFLYFWPLYNLHMILVCTTSKTPLRPPSNHSTTDKITQSNSIAIINWRQLHFSDYYLVQVAGFQILLLYITVDVCKLSKWNLMSIMLLNSIYSCMTLAPPPQKKTNWHFVYVSYMAFIVDGGK